MPDHDPAAALAAFNEFEARVLKPILGVRPVLEAAVAAQRSVTSAEGRLSELRASIGRAEQHLTGLLDELAEKRAAIMVQVTNERDAIERQIIQRRAELQQLSAEVSAERARTEEQKAALRREVTLERTRLQSSLEESRAQTTASIAHLEAEVSSIQTQRDAAAAELATVQEKYRGVQQAIQDLVSGRR